MTNIKEVRHQSIRAAGKPNIKHTKFNRAGLVEPAAPQILFESARIEQVGAKLLLNRAMVPPSGGAKAYQVSEDWRRLQNVLFTSISGAS